MATPESKPDHSVLLTLTDDEAFAVHHAISTTLQLMDQVEAQDGSINPDAPLYGHRDNLVRAAKRLGHERRHHGAVPNPNVPA